MVKHREIPVHKVAPKVKVKVKIGLRIQPPKVRAAATEEVKVIAIPIARLAILIAILRIPINGKRKHKG